MRVLVLHNRYQHRGGEDSVVEAEVKLLREGGHAVHLELVSNDSISGIRAKADTFLHTPFDPSRLPWTRQLIAQHQPDVVHVHNFFPLLTPAIHQGFAEAGVAVVQTLHNYRLTCANALLLREGKVCEKCVGGSKLWGIYHRCYRGSLPGSAAIVRMQMRAERHQTWSRHVHRFVALSEFGKDKFIAAGLPEDRIEVKPNFVDALAAPASQSRSGGLFVGRISEEKGVHLLLEAWRSLGDVPLAIVGDGPDRARLEQEAPPNVRFLGRREAAEIAELMRAASFLVVPSICYETFGLVIVEAFAQKLPVLASNIGALAELVRPGINGDLFEIQRPDLIVAAVRRFQVAPDGGRSLGEGARQTYLASYTPQLNLSRLEEIYDQAILAASAGH